MYLAPFMPKAFYMYLLFILMPLGALAQNGISLKGRDTLSDYSKTFSSDHIYIRNIQIIGNKKTKRKIILREMNVEEGDLVSVDTLAELAEINRKRIYNLALFYRCSGVTCKSFIRFC